jgi:hypothetical protein
MENLIFHNNRQKNCKRQQNWAEYQNKNCDPIQLKKTLPHHAVVIIMLIRTNPTVPAPNMLTKRTFHFCAPAFSQSSMSAIRAELYIVILYPFFKFFIHPIAAFLSFMPGISTKVAKLAFAFVAGQLFVLHAANGIAFAAWL